MEKSAQGGVVYTVVYGKGRANGARLEIAPFRGRRRCATYTVGAALFGPTIAINHCY